MSSSLSIGLFAWTIFASCDSGGRISEPPPPPPARTVHFTKLFEREVPPFPSGVAVTPDGRWLVSLGFREHDVTLYDAQTLDAVAGPFHYLLSAELDSAQLLQPHGLAISPDGELAILGNRTGLIGFALPSMSLVFHDNRTLAGRHVIRDTLGENYFVSEEGDKVARMTPDGTVGALFEADAIEGIALSRDQLELLVLTDFGQRLVILKTNDLHPQATIELPFRGAVIVPLKRDERVIIVGSPGGGGTAGRTPLMALPVDLKAGSVGSLQVLCCEVPGGTPFLFGDGNQWVEVGEATAIVPTAPGTVTIDTNHGTVTLHSAAALQNDIPPCCDVASYPGGTRIVVSHVMGSLIVYEVEERVVSPAD